MKIKGFLLILLLIFSFSFFGCDSNNPNEDDKPIEEKKDFESGTGSQNDPYVIKEGYQWINISKDLDAYYVLGNDISLSSLDKVDPIGNEQTPFKGTIDGKGFTISKANISSKMNTGLFGVVSEATIKNINLDDVLLTYLNSDKSKVHFGVLAGQMKNGSVIENCHAKNIRIDQQATDGIYNVLGGLVGGIYNFSELVYCSVDMVFIGKNGGDGYYDFGGVAGICENSKMVGCAASGTVTITYRDGIVQAKSRRIGGLVYQATNSEIKYCYTDLDFVDNRDDESIAALIYELNNESKVEYNVSYCKFRVDPLYGQYYKNKIPSNVSTQVNLYFKAGEAYTLDDINNIVLADSFSQGYFKEGKLHPVLVDYEIFISNLEK